MGEFIAPGTYRSTISKLKLKSIEKNKKGILVIALKPGILYMRFLTAHLKRTLIKKIIDIKDTQKCIKYQEIFVLSESSLHCNMSKTC